MSAYVGDAINACHPVTVEVTRFRSAPIVKGKLQGRLPESTFDVLGSFQPMSFQELQLLPEGMRTSGTSKFYSQAELFTAELSGCGVPDRFEHNGVRYAVTQKLDWDDAGDYYKYIVTRLDR